MDKQKCIICESENLEEYNALPHPFLVHRMFNGKQFDKEHLYHCKDCGMYWSSFRPNSQEVDRYYKNYMKPEYIADRESCEPGFAQWRNDYDSQNGFDTEYKVRHTLMKNIFSKYIDYSKIKKLLDYGGARGEFIINEFNNAQRFVYDVDTLEPIDSNIKKISKTELKENDYDFIQCCHMLEHVSYPLVFVNEMISLLKVGGYLYLEVPYEDFFMNIINAPNSTLFIHEHINFFRASVFEQIFNNPNFEILENRVIKQPALFGQDKIISCLVKRVEPSDIGVLLNKIHKLETLFSETKNANSVLQQDMCHVSSQISALNEENHKLRSMLERYLSRTTLLQQIFSVKNEGDHKVWQVLGIKMKFRRK